jgi:hypothetical protein
MVVLCGWVPWTIRGWKGWELGGGGSGVLFFRLGLEVCVSRMTTILRDDTRVSPGSERERVEEKLTVLAGFAVG